MRRIQSEWEDRIPITQKQSWPVMGWSPLIDQNTKPKHALRSGIARLVKLTPLLASILFPLVSTRGAEGAINSSRTQFIARDKSQGAFDPEVIELLRNVASPHGYGTNIVKTIVDFQRLKELKSSALPHIASIAETIAEMQSVYMDNAVLQAKLNAVQRRVQEEAFGNLLKYLVKSIANDGRVEIQDVANGTSEFVKPLQDLVLPILTNDLRGRILSDRLVTQIQTLAVNSHGALPAKENILQLSFDPLLARHGFIDFKNITGKPLTNCLVIAKATMNPDYAERVLRSPGEYVLFLHAAGVDANVVENGAVVEDLMVQIRSQPQGMFVFLPRLETNVPIRFKVCDLPGMVFATNMVLRAWSDEVTSKEISLQKGLTTIRMQLIKEQEEQRRQRQLQRQRAPQQNPFRFR